MASATHTTHGGAKRDQDELSLFRLYVMRAIYLLIGLGEDDCGDAEVQRMQHSSVLSQRGDEEQREVVNAVDDGGSGGICSRANHAEDRSQQKDT